MKAIEAAGNTFKMVAQEWVRKQKSEGLADITVDKIEEDEDAAPATRPLSDQMMAILACFIGGAPSLTTQHKSA